MTRIDHIGIATKSIDMALPFWEALGFKQTGGGIVEEQGVEVKYMSNDSDSRIELLEPTGPDTPVGKFIEKRGEGIQQLAISVSDINETISTFLQESRNFTIAPAYNKGAYQVITKSNIKDIGR